MLGVVWKRRDNEKNRCVTLGKPFVSGRYQFSMALGAFRAA